VVEFEKDQKETVVKVEILNSKEQEPDEEFYVELYDPATEKCLGGKDTRTVITITDDDKDPVICFKDNSVIEHLSSDRHARIPVQRLYNTSGEVTVKY
jgi:hypothetical protein